MSTDIKSEVVNKFDIIRKFMKESKASCSTFCNDCPYDNCMNKQRFNNLNQLKQAKSAKTVLKNSIEKSTFDDSDYMRDYKVD